MVGPNFGQEPSFIDPWGNEYQYEYPSLDVPEGINFPWDPMGKPVRFPKMIKSLKR